MTLARRALVASALGAGIAYSNLAVALPLLVLAEHGSALLAGAMLAANTIAFSLAALPFVIAWLRGTDLVRVAHLRPLPFSGFALQLPDMLLVAAMGMLLNLAPVILSHEFRFTPLAIGLVAGGVQAAKIGGSL